MKHQFGLFIGRFQPFHRGHESIVHKMLEECDKVVIAIGSAQESNTKSNPFRYEYRRFIIQKVFPEYFNRIIIVGIADRENPSDDKSWGEYLLDTIYQNINIKQINTQGKYIIGNLFIIPNAINIGTINDKFLITS